MSWLKDAFGAVVELGKFVLLGQKPKVVLEEPLGELEIEKEKQRVADLRRERAARRNHGGK